jgi:hypothetical protein
MAFKKYKVGTVKMKKDNSGVTVELGAWSKNDNYKFDVELIVRDSKGNVVARKDTAKDRAFLQVVDPRKATDKDGNPLSEERLSKIPAEIKSELFVVVGE